MALDPEELKRKRQQRKAQRQSNQKKLILSLIAAGVVLVLCGALILGFAFANASPPDQPAEPPTPSATQSPDQPEQPTTEPEPTQPPTTVIHFAAAGDLNITDRVVASGGTGYDYTETFQDVAHLLADADLATVNLEGNFCGAPYGSNASAPQNLATALKRAGVDMVQLANSYSIHRGISGLISTIEGVQQAGMEPLGAFTSQQEFERKKGFSLFEVEGVRVAVVAFTKGMQGDTLVAGYEDCVNVLYSDYNSVYQKIDREKILSVLDAVHQEQPDIIISLLHWGSEYNDTISSSQKSICRLLQENGVDAIIGTHPHYVQQITFDPEAGTLIAYSLGDFLSDVPRAGSEYSILLDLEITKDNETGEAAITGYEYIPLFSVVEEGKPSRVVRIHEAVAAYEAGYMNAVSKETYEDMLYALLRIEQRVAGN